MDPIEKTILPLIASLMILFEKGKTIISLDPNSKMNDFVPIHNPQWLAAQWNVEPC